MLRQFFRDHRFVLLIGCGFVAIVGYKWLSHSNRWHERGVHRDREGAPTVLHRDREGSPTAPSTNYSAPEISAEKRQRISELYDRHSPDRDNVNRDADWATTGPPREEVNILADGLDALRAAKFLKALGGYAAYAREYADKALAANPDDFETLLVWTQFRNSDEQTEEIAGYRRLLEMNPNSIPALVGLGRRLARNAPEEAIEVLERANKLDSSAGLYHLGISYQSVGEYDKALSVLKKEYARYPAPILKSHIEAIESGNPWIRPIPSENQGGWQDEEVSPTGRHRDQEVSPTVTRAISPPEIPAEKRQRISELYDRHSPDRDNVNRDADWATTGPPREEVDILADGLDDLSAAKFLKALGGHATYAREYADKALAANPDDFETLLVWTKLRVDDEEREYGYRRLLEMAPNSVTVLTGLGSLLANDAPEEAIEHLEKANSLDATAGLYELGWAYQRVGEYDKAVTALKKAYQRYNRPRMLSEIRSIEAGTPQVPLIQQLK